MTNYEKIINMCLDEMTVFFNGQTMLCVSEHAKNVRFSKVIIIAVRRI